MGEGDASASYTFQIEIEGVPIAQFKEVGGISSEVQVIEHRENKLKGIPVMKKLPGSRKFADLSLKRGKTKDTELWKWHKQVTDGDIDGARKNGSIVLYDYKRGEIGRYNFTAGWPSKVSIGNLTAQGNEILIEECTIAHEGIEFA